MAAHSSILAWKIPWTEEPGGLQCKGGKRVGTWLSTHQTTCSQLHCCTRWFSTLKNKSDAQNIFSLAPPSFLTISCKIKRNQSSLSLQCLRWCQVKEWRWEGFSQIWKKDGPRDKSAHISRPPPVPSHLTFCGGFIYFVLKQPGRWIQEEVGVILCVLKPISFSWLGPFWGWLGIPEPLLSGEERGEGRRHSWASGRQMPRTRGAKVIATITEAQPVAKDPGGRWDHENLRKHVISSYIW